MESASEFWIFIGILLAAGGAYMVSANGIIEEIIKRLRRK